MAKSRSIPDWFAPVNYAATATYTSAKPWAKQFRRRKRWRPNKKGQMVEQFRLFTQGTDLVLENFEPDSPPNGLRPLGPFLRDSAIRTLQKGDVVRAARRLPPAIQGSSRDDLAWSLEDLPIQGHKLYVAIDARLPNEQLRKQFNAWLRNRPMEAGNTNREVFSPKDFRRWHQNKLLPLMDLVIWFESLGSEFPSTAVADLLYADMPDPSNSLKDARKAVNSRLTDASIATLNAQADAEPADFFWDEDDGGLTIRFA